MEVVTSGVLREVIKFGEITCRCLGQRTVTSEK